MMATTHVLVGLLVGAVAAAVAPVTAPVALLAGALGGLLPDLDLVDGHRRRLHFPVYYGVAAAGALLAALAWPSAPAVALAVGLVAAALHCAMDALGGALEHRPWEATAENAVYSHFHGRWLGARRWVRYDGAPEDLALAAVAATPLLVVGPRRVVAALLVVSLGYTLVRRRLVVAGEWLADRLPASVLAALPDGVVGDYA